MAEGSIVVGCCCTLSLQNASVSELERGPNLPRPRRDIIASRPRRDFKVTRLEPRHETS